MDFTNDCHDGSFEIFSRPPTEIGLQAHSEHEIHPQTEVTKSATSIDFLIPGDGDEYVDLSSLRLHLRVKVEGSAAIAENEVSLIKFWPQGLFRQVDMFLNGTLVTTSSSMYGYTAYVMSLLSYSSEVKRHQMEVMEHASGWDIVPDQLENEAFSHLNLPLCNQSRFIPNGVSIKLRLLRASDEFLVVKHTDKDITYKVLIDHCTLFVNKVIPTPSLLLEHTQDMSTMNCIYPVERVWSKFHTLSKGSREFDIPNVCQGQLPNRVVIGLVDSESFSGTPTSDPFKFEPFNLEHLSLQCNGRSIPSVPLTMDYKKNFFRRAYHQLLNTVQGPCEDNESLGISLTDFKTNSCFYAITLSRALAGPSQAVPQREQGYVNAKLRFNTALPKNVNVIFFMEFQNYVEIDSSRNIYLDYAA